MASGTRRDATADPAPHACRSPTKKLPATPIANIQNETSIRLAQVRSAANAKPASHARKPIPGSTS